MYYYDKYYSTADKAALDSALLYIDEEMKENPKEKWSLYCYKLTIYSIKEEYDKALSSCPADRHSTTLSSALVVFPIAEMTTNKPSDVLFIRTIFSRFRTPLASFTEAPPNLKTRIY